MRRIELVQAVQQVHEALNKTKLVDLLFPFTRYAPTKESREEAKLPITELFEALNRYSIIAHGFHTNAKKVEKILGLEQFSIEITKRTAQNMSDESILK